MAAAGESVLLPWVSNVSWIAMEPRERAFRVLADVWAPDAASPAAGFQSLSSIARDWGYPGGPLVRPMSKVPVLLLGEAEHLKQGFLHWYTGGLIPGLDEVPKSSGKGTSAPWGRGIQVVTSGPRAGQLQGPDSLALLDSASPLQAVPEAEGLVTVHMSISKHRAFPCMEFFALAPGFLHSALEGARLDPGDRGAPPRGADAGFALASPAAAAAAAAAALGEACHQILVLVDASSPPRLPSVLSQYLRGLPPSALARTRFLLCSNIPSSASSSLPGAASSRLLRPLQPDLDTVALKLASSISETIPGLSSLSAKDVLQISPAPAPPTFPSPTKAAATPLSGPSTKGTPGPDLTPASPFPPLSVSSTPSPASGKLASGFSGLGPCRGPFPLPPPACLPSATAPDLSPGLHALERILDDTVNEYLRQQARQLQVDSTQLKTYLSRKLLENEKQLVTSVAREGGGSSLVELAAASMTVWTAVAFPFAVPVVDRLRSIAADLGPSNLLSHDVDSPIVVIREAVTSSPFFKAAPEGLLAVFAALPAVALVALLLALLVSGMTLRKTQRWRLLREQRFLELAVRYCSDALGLASSARLP